MLVIRRTIDNRLVTEDRLIMKQVQLVEITSFIEFAPQYFQHVSEAIMNKVYEIHVLCTMMIVEPFM